MATRSHLHRPPVILCAEDQDELRTDICEELEEAGYTALGATDGEATLQQIDAASPDLILCDINMPGPNGYAVLETLREQRPHLADTPFIFLTALSDRRDIVEGKLHGADDYLVKPIDYDLLLATIEAQLRQVRRMREKSTHEVDSLRRAMTDLRHSAKQNAFHAATRALDLVAPGMVLIDANATVAFANQRAICLAQQIKALSITNTLTIQTGLGRGLREAVASAIEASKQGKEPVFTLRLEHQPGEHGLLILVCALGLNTSATMPSDIAAVVLLSALDQHPPLPQSVLSSIFGLTPTEARIAGALLEGRRTEKIAQDMKISSTTVAFHLRNLFQKTGTHRQAELIALLLAGSMTANLQGR